MKAWFLDGTRQFSTTADPLRLDDVPIPEPGANEVLIKVSCCGICHTEIDEIEGRTSPPHFPVIPGHQVVGVIERRGAFADDVPLGARVGVAWIYSTCGACDYCKAGLENLCDAFRATGRDVNGGYAEYMVANKRFLFLLPPSWTDVEAAPLLCAGAIGYRSLVLTGLRNAAPLGLCGFGSSAHLVIKMARHQFPDSPIYVFARNSEEREFAIRLGAAWAGDFGDTPPSRLQAIIDTTPVWTPVLSALERLSPGGRLVINAIRKEARDQQELLKLSYEHHLWQEKEIKSVANITRTDVVEFLTLAASIGITPKVETYPFEQANRALHDLWSKRVVGSKVLLCSNHR